MVEIYYNENDPKVAAWLQELMHAGQIPSGCVDERSIEDVCPEDLRDFDQCHFFAGIGGWAYALQLAGWGDRPIWTGSCPCQPFSSAGKGGGFADERHLWPAWFWLIQQCRPATIVGEQVASKAGRVWLDVVCTDLEAENYACGAADLAAASVGAPHIRQRHFWVGDTDVERLQRGGTNSSSEVRNERRRAVESDGAIGRVENSRSEREHPLLRRNETSSGRIARDSSQAGGRGASLWSSCDWLPCQDGKYRPVEPGTFPLAHGAPARVGRLRGYGNAIVPQVAAAFIGAYMEVRGIEVNA